MSCLEVMYHHQNYGTHHYLPTSAYKAAYFHHQQQKKLSAYSRIQDSVDLPVQCDQSKAVEKPRAELELQRERVEDREEEARCKDSQPAETEYLSSRCVLFTYFHGDIGTVVDEHFSRALSQPGAFSHDSKSNKLPSGGTWKDPNSVSEGQCGSLPSSVWSNAYPSQTIPSAHSDFPASAAFHPAETGIWSGHSVAQHGLPPTPALTDSWPYALSGQSGAGYHHVHEMYSHMHSRHPHPHVHAHPMVHHSHVTALDPRFSPLLLPGMKTTFSPSTSNSDGIKTELEPTALNWPSSFHGSVDIYDTAMEQDKAKVSVWF